MYNFLYSNYVLDVLIHYFFNVLFKDYIVFHGILWIYFYHINTIQVFILALYIINHSDVDSLFVLVDDFFLKILDINLFFVLYILYVVNDTEYRDSLNNNYKNLKVLFYLYLISVLIYLDILKINDFLHFIDNPYSTVLPYLCFPNKVLIMVVSYTERIFYLE